jgi:hypothetical protein
MNVRYKPAALADLGEIADCWRSPIPAIAAVIERRIRMGVARIKRWPESVRRSAKLCDATFAAGSCAW